MELLWGLACSTAVGGLAYWRRSLSLSGFLAAVAVGTAMFVWGTVVWFGTLIAFFVSSSLLSSWKRRRKSEAEGVYEKSGRRDAGQVFANGGLAAILCGLFAWDPSPIWWYAFLGVMATVNSDTWATEIGGLSRTPPRHIRTGRKVKPGTSGGVTRLGMAATVIGGAFIGAVAWLLERITGIWIWSFGSSPILGVEEGWISGSAAVSDQWWVLLLLGIAGGTVGSLTDSWLGATVQRIRRCTVCGREVERLTHCGRPAEPIRGWRWFNNDRVNMVSSVAGGLMAVLLGVWLS
jgi:uncharacterized protein (TIGR00297 family)